mgnify:CR=1 FL=1
MDDNKTVKQITSNKGSWKRFGYVLSHARLPWIWIVVVLIVSLAATKLELLLPQYTSNLLNGDTSAHMIKLALFSAGALFVVTFASNLVQGIGEVSITRNLRSVVWKRILGTKPSGFGDTQPGEIISRVTTDTEVIGLFIIKILYVMIPSIYFAVSVIITLYGINHTMLYWMLACIPFSVAATVVWGRYNFSVQVKVYERISNLTHYLSDRITKMPLIKSYGTEEEEVAKGEEPIEGMYKARVEAQKVMCAGNIAFNVIMGYIPNVILMLIGASLIGKGQLSFGDWVMFFMYTSRMTASISVVIFEWADIKGTQGAIMRVSGIMMNPSEFDETYPEKGAHEGDIELRDLQFSYGTEEIFENLTMTIKEGKKTVLVGGSGSGKTTLLKLLERFYDVGDGQILFNGKDINTYDIAATRKAISYISQDAPMLGDTVREAVTYGVGRTVTDEEIVQALEAASAWDFVQKMPAGIDSSIGDYGCRLSGGQRQKIALTRGLLRNSRYVLLDESTSSMDACSALNVQKAIDNYIQGRTCIMISNNVSIVMEADEVIVLKDGGVEAVGDHESLLRDSATYREFCSQGRECQL